jgi:hypothetical protein
LRAVPDGATVAGVLARALAAAHAQPVAAITSQTEAAGPASAVAAAA